MVDELHSKEIIDFLRDNSITKDASGAGDEIFVSINYIIEEV